MVPVGEKAFTKEEISKVSEKDGKYLTTDSDTQFPYHRFDVSLDKSVDEIGYSGPHEKEIDSQEKSVHVRLEPSARSFGQ